MKVRGRVRSLGLLVGLRCDNGGRSTRGEMSGRAGALRLATRADDGGRRW